MQDILRDFSETASVRRAIKANWENYHYFLGRSPCAELSIGRYLTWLITDVPDHFMNLVVCTQLPPEDIDKLIESALAHFKLLNIKRLSWLTEEGVPATELKKRLIAHGLTFEELFAIEMAADLMNLPQELPVPPSLTIIPVEDKDTLKNWIHIASVGFGVPLESESSWCDMFAEAVFELPFRNYLALLNGEPVGTSQLFLSAGVAGIYNVTCLPHARGQGIGAAITMAPLLEGRRMGYRISILQASEQGARVYRRLGFQEYGKLSVFLWDGETAL
jgi:GNAT superfamily N-acetyltransferase